MYTTLRKYEYIDLMRIGIYNIFKVNEWLKVLRLLALANRWTPGKNEKAMEGLVGFEIEWIRMVVSVGCCWLVV